MTAPDTALFVARLAALRAELDRRGLDAFIVPRADPHQSEYIPDNAERLSWLTGFTGSAGVAVVVRDRAAIFIDGRYTLQVRDQVDTHAFQTLHLVTDSHTDWAARAVGDGGRVGFDPWLHTAPWVDQARQTLEKTGAALVPVADNPVDAIWDDRPPPPQAPIVPHPVAYAGETAESKRSRLGTALAEQEVDAAVLTSGESLAWLLNIRGGDVARTPLTLGFALLHRDGHVELFVDPAKLTAGLETHLGNAVSVQPPDAFGPALDRLGAEGKTVLVDPQRTVTWVFDRLHRVGAVVQRGEDPVVLPRACKNETELAGSVAAHIRDGAAMVRFLAWLDRAAETGQVTEIGAADRLRAIRAEDPLFRDISFDTISGAGPNGALVHYRATAATDRVLDRDSLYLVDSGAQYLDGTTDITRTVAIGRPTEGMRRHATLVLKGHIALSTALFPEGVKGSQLDCLARQFLWAEGLDYDHGTGHGVGSYLGVHEGPQRISAQPNTVALKPGMILSNEPGYYRSGAYGIRIENLVAVAPRPTPADGERPLLGFDVLTLCPIDRRLVVPELLTPAERDWLNGYHARVHETVGPLLGDAADRTWLDAATEPI